MTTVAERPLTATQRILAWLADHRSGRFAEISAGASLGAGTTSAALKNLVEAGKIVKLETGRYGLPPECPPHHWQAPPPSGPYLRLVCRICGGVSERPNPLYGAPPPPSASSTEPKPPAP